MSAPGGDSQHQGHRQDSAQEHRRDRGQEAEQSPEQRRERDITASFVSLSTALATGADVVDLLGDLAQVCARLLDVDSAGLLLADGLGTLHVMAATSSDTRDLEVFQSQRQQGPCLDCYQSGEAVTVPDLRGARQRWPAFAEVALSMGFTSVHAVPMRLRQRRLGALGLFGRDTGDLNVEDLQLGQALADVASVAILQNSRLPDPAEEAVVVSTQLQAALAARIMVEQAKGVLSYSGGLSMEEALQVLRSYAVERKQRLSEVAVEVVNRRVSAAEVLAHHVAGGPAAGHR